MAHARIAFSPTISPGRKRKRGVQEYIDETSESGESLIPSLEDETVPGSSIAATPLTPVSPRRKYPSDEKSHHCPHKDCLKSFNRPARLLEHLRSHNNERPFRCSHEGCEKSFLRETHLSHHTKSAHTSIRDHACQWPGCGKQFLTATRLRRHQAVHQGQEKFRCTGYPPCEESFRKHTTLQRHVSAVHLQEKPFACSRIDPRTSEACTQKFDTAAGLRSHEGRVHGGSRFWCRDCGEAATGLGFATYAQLQEHLRQTHPPRCNLCQQSCTTQGELRRHLEMRHALPDKASRVFTCTEESCGRNFSKQYNLSVHVRTVHEGEKRFGCGTTDLSNSSGISGWSGEGACGRAFKTKSSLESHVRSQHLSAKARAARPRPRTTEGDAASLLTVLTGAGYADLASRPIECPVAGCAYRFVRGYDKTQHLRARHGVLEGGGPMKDLVGEEEEEGLDEAFDAFIDLERSAERGGEFWVGGGGGTGEEDFGRDDAGGDGGRNEEGMLDEMRCLIALESAAAEGEEGDVEMGVQVEGRVDVDVDVEMGGQEEGGGGGGDKGGSEGEGEEGVIDPCLLD